MRGTPEENVTNMYKMANLIRGFGPPRVGRDSAYGVTLGPHVERDVYNALPTHAGINRHPFRSCSRPIVWGCMMVLGGGAPHERGIPVSEFATRDKNRSSTIYTTLCRKISFCCHSGKSIPSELLPPRVGRAVEMQDEAGRGEMEAAREKEGHSEREIE